MARLLNAYQSPVQDIGRSLATAIFGDPQAAAKQRQMQAEAELRAAQAREAEARGGLYTEQTRGARTGNDAQASLPDMIRAWGQAQQPVAPQTTDTPGFDNFDAPMPAAPQQPDKVGALANLIGTMGQMNGQHIDPTKIMGAYGAFGGDDEMARRSLVAQGHTPAANFAITPQRADQIAATDAGAKQSQAWGVARINHANDVPVANLQAGARRYAADQSLAGTRYSADAREGAAGGKAGGPSFDFIARAIPGATMTSGWRSAEHNQEVGGVPNSNHLGLNPGVQAYDIPAQPGMTVEQAAAKIEEQSGGAIRVVEARDERGRVGPNGKPLGGWHFALQNTGAKLATASAAKSSKPVTPAVTKQFSTMLDDGKGGGFLGNNGIQLDQATKSGLLAKMEQVYRETGNIQGAYNQAVSLIQVNGKRVVDRGANGDDRSAAPSAQQRLSPADAARLPKGAHFTGMDGVERIKH